MGLGDAFQMVGRVAGRLKRNALFLMTNDLEDRFYRAKDEAVEDSVYEWDENRVLLPSLEILTGKQTIDILCTDPKSFARYGDGEIDIMQGKDTPFQEYDPMLDKKLKDILAHKRDDLYVGINRSYFQSPFRYAERNHRFYRERSTKYRRFFIEHCDPSNTYLDSSCFGAYFRYGESFDYESHYASIKELFRDRKLILVAGEGVLEKLTFDVFELAASKKVIHAPSRNASMKYDQIYRSVVDGAAVDSLIGVILGQTATALVADLAQDGYTAWDLGHIAKDYDVYMRGVEKTKENMDDFWAAD